jgi:hypothetical protein
VAEEFFFLLFGTEIIPDYNDDILPKDDDSGGHESYDDVERIFNAFSGNDNPAKASIAWGKNLEAAIKQSGGMIGDSMLNISLLISNAFLGKLDFRSCNDADVLYASWFDSRTNSTANTLKYIRDKQNEISTDLVALKTIINLNASFTRFDHSPLRRQLLSPQLEHIRILTLNDYLIDKLDKLPPLLFSLKNVLDDIDNSVKAVDTAVNTELNEVRDNSYWNLFKTVRS